MPRLTIYVTEKLKARMDAVGDAINWSEVVRPAIEAAVATQEHLKGQNMETTIERLRASKGKLGHEKWNQGQLDGHKWATGSAEYDELARVAELEFEPDNCDGASNALRDALSPHGELTWQEICENLFGDYRLSPDEPYIGGFIAGARAVFEEVEDQI
jgi:hypothetical protein